MTDPDRYAAGDTGGLIHAEGGSSMAKRFAVPPHGITVWIEVKRQGGKARPAQLEFEERCRSTWQPYIRGTLDDVQSWLRDEGYLR